MGAKLCQTPLSPTELTSNLLDWSLHYELATHTRSLTSQGLRHSFKFLLQSSFSMSSTKRTASSRTTRLTSRVSEFNPQVTLIEAADTLESPRRSKRIKVEVKTEERIADLEDLKCAPSSTVETEATASSSSTPLKIRNIKTEPESGSSTPLKKKGDVKSPKKAKAVPQALNVPHPAPPKWRETYDTIKDMRLRFVAPVDTMGCQQAQVAEKDPKVSVDFSVQSILTIDHFIESTIRNPRFSHALFTDQRRSDKCSR